METGAEVWAKKADGDWFAATILAKTPREDGTGYALVVVGESGEELGFVVEGDNNELDELKLRNDQTDAAVENLINLPHLHEPAILYCLEQRYHKSDIYTYTGPILIAVNPFKRVPLYTTQILESYYNAGLLKAQGIESLVVLGPHIYAIADAAFRDMMMVISSGHNSAVRDSSANQAILISGESGAGKTESTKIVLRYLTTVGNSSGGTVVADGSVMDKVLQSNPILEAFGNAKTIRNDNSSRFGKFIELNFSKRGHLVGGTIRTYLLEKVRLPAQQPGERNFHVFYQMAAGGSEEEAKLWHLKSIQDYFYTNQGSVYKLRDFNDAEEYAELRRALNTLNFTPEVQNTIFMSMAGILHLGQLQFVTDHDGEGSELSKDASITESAQFASSLLGISCDSLLRTLTTRIIVTRDESMEKKLTVREALAARDALVKAIYGRLFNRTVQTINMSIQVESSIVRADIGVLDIFGFECFKHNSFEQLCINYTNETLQQQFNQFVFKMEQQEYKKEKIEWSFISFPDNQDCLDLIENKQNGILAMIDDECRLPKATDEKLASRMYKAFESQSRFSATAPQKRDSMFCIKHYAGSVVYCTITFVEKNKDELPKEAVALMCSSTHALLSDIFVLDPIPDCTVAQQKQTIDKIEKKLSVSAQFKHQLGTLMDKVYQTKPHYIRCLKPNDLNVPDNFDRIRTTEQLRYGGVLEAVRVARSGFPVRLGHADFFARYRPLANPFVSSTKTMPRILSSSIKDPRTYCEELLHNFWDHTFDPNDPSMIKVRSTRKIAELVGWLGNLSISKESVQLGLTKIFLRKEAHDVLESRRSRRMAGAARLVQSMMRFQRVRRWFIHQIQALRTIQRALRGMQGRSLARHIRRTRSAMRIQTSWRMHMSRFKFRWYLYSVTTLQSLLRAKKSRKLYREMLYSVHGTRLNMLVHVLFARHRLLKCRRAVIALQCRLRRRIAKNMLKQLRIQAKDVGTLKQSNDALKAEIEMLRTRARQDAEDRAKEAALEAEQRAVERANAEQNAKIALYTDELEKTKALLSAERARCQELEEIVKSKDLQVMNFEDLLNEERLARARSIASLESLQTQRTSISISTSTTPPNSFTGGPRTSFTQPLPTPPISSPKVVPDLETTNASTTYSFVSISQSAVPDPSVRVNNSNSAANEPVRTVVTQAQGALQDSPSSSNDSSGVKDNALRLALEEERVSRSLLEEEVARLRRISMDLATQMDTLRRGQITSSGTSGSGSGAGVTRRPDENPHRRRPQFSTANPTLNAQPSKSLPAVDPSKKVGMANLIRVPPSAEDTKEEYPEADTTTREAAAKEQEKKTMLAAAEATSTWNKNLNNFKLKLQQGVLVNLWEGDSKDRYETKLRLNSANNLITFEVPKKKTNWGVLSSYWGVKDELAPIKVCDIFDCFSYGNRELLETGNNSWVSQNNPAFSDSKSEQTLLTLVCQSEGTQVAVRTLCMQLPSKEDRNFMVSGFRMMRENNPLAGQQVRSNLVMPKSVPATAVVAVATQPSAIATSAKVNSPSKPEAQFQAPVSRRRVTKRDAAIEETRARKISDVTASPNPALSSRSSTIPYDSSPSSETTQETAAKLLSSPIPAMERDATMVLKNQLQDERINNDRLRTQALLLQNELHERDEEIVTLKKERLVLESTMKAKQLMYDQDCHVRMQIGQKLEQTILDREEQKELNEALSAEILRLKQKIAQMAAGIESPVKGPITVSMEGQGTI